VADLYLDLVTTGRTRAVAKRLGLPQPVILRRTDPASVDDPRAPGPVVVLAPPRADADAAVLARAATAWRANVQREAPPGTAVGAVVLVLTHVERPADLAESALALAPALRALAPGGRVVVVARPAGPDDGAELAAARQAVDGFMRSVAHELRFGATGNAILLGPDVPADAPSVLGALRFLLSARSAFVSGQPVLVGSAAGTPPGDWSRPLVGRLAVVTGAARGIGAAIARVLARDGARVIGVDVPAAGERLAALANEVGGTALQMDITAPDASDRLLDHVLRRTGQIDVVVHNAGITRDRLLVHMSRERWDAVLAVNLEAQLRINAAVLGADALAPEGRLVHLASTSGIAGNRGQTNYAASKAGVIGMTRALARDVARAGRGATANAVAPGFIETDMTARIPAVPRELARRASTLRQGGQPVDVAEAVAFLASPQAGGVSGQVLRVCGQNLSGA
jgi:3-oxoacyl-[acyl-carrier protein] reductase